MSSESSATPTKKVTTRSSQIMTWIRRKNNRRRTYSGRRSNDEVLLDAVIRNEAAAVQHALRNGANVNGIRSDSTPLMEACERGYDDIVRILLEAGANARYRSDEHWSAIDKACGKRHVSTIDLLLNHDNGLLEIADGSGWTPLLFAFITRKFEVANLLLDRGANALATDKGGSTALLVACRMGADLEIVRRLLAAGSNVEARDNMHRTALLYATSRGNIEMMRELIVKYNASMFAADTFGTTPFDFAARFRSAGRAWPLLIECYSNTVNQEHGRLALHAVLIAAEYSFGVEDEFHPPQNPLRICVQLGKLTLNHFRTLLSTLDTELIRNRNDSGKLPIHIACRKNAPVESLALILEQDAAMLRMTDYTGALPLHECCCGAVDDSSVRLLVEQGGVGTLAARNQDGALPLHLLCGSTNPSLRTVQYMIHSFPGSVAAQTNRGQYPFMIAACEASTASLSVVYELVRTNPDLVIPH